MSQTHRPQLLNPEAVMERLLTGSAVISTDEHVERLCLQHHRCALQAAEGLVVSSAVLRELAPAGKEAVEALHAVATALPRLLDQVKRDLWPDPQVGPGGEAISIRSAFNVAPEVIGNLIESGVDHMVDSSFLRAEVEAFAPRSLSRLARCELERLLAKFPQVPKRMANQVLDQVRAQVASEHWVDPGFGLARCLTEKFLEVFPHAEAHGETGRREGPARRTSPSSPPTVPQESGIAGTVGRPKGGSSE